MTPVVVARGLAVGYPHRTVVEGVDLDGVTGSGIALVGSNGSGKSTLLRTLVGLLTPRGGTVEVLGAPPGTTPGEIAYLSQFHDSGFVLPLRAIDVVRMARFDQRGRFARATRADESIVAESMERLGVSHLAQSPLRALSGGQQQRVYLAQVLARQASLLVLDEPTSGLDAAGRELYLAAMAQERARGAVLVTSTHDLGEAVECDRVVLLAGRVVASGTPDEVLTPNNLLATFGVALAQKGDRLIVTDAHHEHHGHQH
jgi:ABC-type Mn2+/Zn2+ transport system ATPase subunit